MDIINKKTPEDSTLAVTDERKCVMFAFLVVDYLAQNDCFQQHHSTCEFHNFFVLIC